MPHRSLQEWLLDGEETKGHTSSGLQLVLTAIVF
jgi:hypothetical protein